MKGKHMRIIIIIIINFHLLTGCSSGNRNTKTGNRNLNGSELYNKYCIGCHGNDGTAGMMHAANLKNSRLTLPLIMQRISDGKGGMPAFKTKMSDKEIMKLAGYVQALQK